MYYPQEETYYPGENRGYQPLSSSLKYLNIQRWICLRGPIYPRFPNWWINKWENTIFSKSRMIPQTSFISMNMPTWLQKHLQIDHCKGRFVWPLPSSHHDIPTKYDVFYAFLCLNHRDIIIWYDMIWYDTMINENYRYNFGIFYISFYQSLWHPHRSSRQGTNVPKSPLVSGRICSECTWGGFFLTICNKKLGLNGG